MTRFHPNLPRPLFLFPGIAAALAAVGVAAFLLAPAPVAAVVVPAALQPAAQPAADRERACASCGVVRTIRRIDPATGAASYDFSVRMRDGTSRDSSHATRGAWIEGDRMILIGGTAARALEEQRQGTAL